MRGSHRVFSTKAGAACLAVLILLSVLPAAGRAETVPVRFMNDDGTWYSYEVPFSDGVFTRDCGDYQPELARMSLAMAVSAFRDWEEPEHKQHLGEDFLAGAGFTDVRSWDYKGDPTKDTLGMLMGRKRVDGRTVVALAPSGEYYRQEWISNLHVGDREAGPILRHEGFHRAAEKAYARLTEYTKDMEEPWILWSAGFSRAGAVADITAALALQRGLLTPERVYVYTFASPCHTVLSAEERPGEKYRGCWNLISPYDVICGIFPSSWGFERFGHTVLLPDPENRERAEELKKAAAAWALEHFQAEWYQNALSSAIADLIDGMTGRGGLTPEAYVRTAQDMLQAKMSEAEGIGEVAQSVFGDSLEESEKTEDGAGTAMKWVRRIAETVFGMDLRAYFTLCVTYGHRPMNYIPAVMCAEQGFFE